MIPMILIMGCSPVKITEESKVSGYTEDGRVDMLTMKGIELFEEECIKKGIKFTRMPLPDREANTRDLMR